MFRARRGAVRSETRLGTRARVPRGAAHAETESARARAALLADALTPVAKSFPAEWGFEANALAVQVHGGYGYSSEQLPEAWLREQKLNSIHEGTTGIHGLDLLGRRIVAGGGRALAAILEEIERACALADEAGVPASLVSPVRAAAATLGEVTSKLAQKGLAGDVSGMLLHSTDYLSLASITLVAWMWLWQAGIARRALTRGAAEPGTSNQDSASGTRPASPNLLPLPTH